MLCFFVSQCAKKEEKKYMFIFFVKAQFIRQYVYKNYRKNCQKSQITKKAMAAWNDGPSQILDIFEVCNR